MSERKKTHNGRDVSGNFRVRQEDFEDKLDDPQGVEHIRDDVRLGGAVADTSVEGGQQGHEIEKLVANNRADVDHLTGRDREGAS